MSWFQSFRLNSFVLFSTPEPLRSGGWGSLDRGLHHHCCSAPLAAACTVDMIVSKHYVNKHPRLPSTTVGDSAPGSAWFFPGLRAPSLCNMGGSFKKDKDPGNYNNDLLLFRSWKNKLPGLRALLPLHLLLLLLTDHINYNTVESLVCSHRWVPELRLLHWVYW